METKKLIILSALMVLLIVLALAFFKCGGEEKIKPLPLASTEEASSSPDEPRELKVVTLFFASESDEYLHPEEREIPTDPSVVNQARMIIHELLDGPRGALLNPFPPETKLRELFVTPAGVAYVDFSREIQDHHMSGSSAEIVTVFSIVNSLTHNLDSIKKVFILIDGGEKDTLAGHVDLSRPLVPRKDIEAR